MYRALLLLVLLSGSLLLAGCGGDTAAITTPVAAVTADSALAALKAANLPIGETTVYTADTDPNKLLGRPGQYIGKLSWHDTRLPAPAKPQQIEVSDGGGLELYTDNAGAQARADYIAKIGKSLPAAAEYDYVRGPLVLRLGKSLTPDQAGEYKKAFDTIPVP